MRVLGCPLLTNSLPPEHDRGASRPVKGLAIFGVARGVEHCHGHCRETIPGDDGAQIIEEPSELIDLAPDMTPLLDLGRVPPGRKCRVGAEGDHVLGKQRT